MKLALLLSLLVGGCAAERASGVSDESNLDTSGCSGVAFAENHGPVSLSAVRPPNASCWNVDDSGLVARYTWTQKNDATPEKTSLGFWVALNGASDFQKPDSIECHATSSGGLGHDTSGDSYFACTATKHFAFRNDANLKAAAYGADGHRLAWDVQIAIALDAVGHWDSLDGANYRFSL